MILAKFLTTNLVEEFLKENGFIESGKCNGFHSGDTFFVSVFHGQDRIEADETFYLFENEEDTGKFKANYMGNDGEVYDITEEFSTWVNRKEQEAEAHQESFAERR